MDSNNDYSIRNIATNPCMLFLRNNLNKKPPKKINESNDKFWMSFDKNGSFFFDLPLPPNHVQRGKFSSYGLEKASVTIRHHKKKNPVMTMHFVDAVNEVRIDIATQDDPALDLPIKGFIADDNPFDHVVYHYLAKHVNCEAEDFAHMNILTERFLFHGITFMKETK